MEQQIIYLKTNEEFENAKKLASQKSQAVIEMLRRGESLPFIAESCGVTYSLVSGLAKMLGVTWTKKRSYFVFGKMAASGIVSIPLERVGIDLSVVNNWKILDIDKKKKTLTVEWE